MASIVDKALEPLHVDPKFQVLLHQKITNSFLVCRVLVLISILLFIGFLGFTCRDANTSVAQQLLGGAEKRDLDHHIEVLCSTDYKSRNFWIFLLFTAEMFCGFMTMFFLKVWLDKLAYYCCRKLRLPLAKFHERMVVFSHKENDESEIQRKLNLWTKGGFIAYIFVVFINVTVPLTSLILRYSITSLRDVFTPVSKKCGPDVLWVDDDDFNSEFKCHFEQEWQLLYIVISSDILLICFTLWLPCTLIFVYRAFYSKYFDEKKRTKEYQLDLAIMGIKEH